MNTFLTRITLVVSFASVAHAQTCSDLDGQGTAATDALCRAALGGEAEARDYAMVQSGDLTAINCPSGACDLDTQQDFDACCAIPNCDESDDAYDYTCAAGATFAADPTTTPQDGTAATCCVAKQASDCAFASEYFCEAFAGLESATDPCLTTDCDTCTTHMIEPAAAFATQSPANTCEENTCAPMSVDKAASFGIAFANDPSTYETVSDLADNAGAVSAAAGWDFPAGMTSASVAVAAACTGADDGTGTACALNGAGTACAVDGGDCAYTRAASITCTDGTGVSGGAAGTGEFTVVGAEGYTCTVPTTAPDGTVITGMACSNTQTGDITCETPHTCDDTTHHATSAGISTEGPDGLSGTADDGVKCLTDGGVLTLVTAEARVIDAGNSATDATGEYIAGCNINICAVAAAENGYSVADASANTVPGLGATTCEYDAANGAGADSTNWWSEGTCTGTVDADVYGKVADAVDDCPTWQRFGDTGQAADCPAGCTFDQTAATVTCAQATGEADGTNPFVYTGCSQAKCNDLTGDDDQASTEFQAADCGKGMTIKGDLAVPCTGATCENWDCCTDDDGCASTADGFDPADAADDNQGPCWGTNSACIDVPAPGVGNTCTCCDGTLHASLRDATEDNGGCGGDIGFFGQDVTSVDAASSADVAAVQGSCTACTPIANSAEAHTPPSQATDVDEPAQMVTCTEADNSRAVACVTGAITVDNSANGVSDVCRLECPFTEVVALIDRLHIHTDGCAAVDLADTMTEAQQTTACEAVAGCYYTVAGADPVANPATCRPIYAGCNAVAAGATDCDAGPTLSGVDGVLNSPDATPAVVSADDVNACVLSDMGTAGDTSDDKCQYNPSTSTDDYESTITRCDALLATNWAHDLRDSCDATRACPLHGLISATPPGMIAMVKAVYTAAGAAPAGTDTWAAGDAPAAAGGSGATTLSLTDTDANAYFLNDGDANSDTDWEVCMNIRDAVLAAPTCSAGSGR